MNDDTDKPLNTVGDDALEARITAWVLGEASSFEAGELEKLCAADPALGLFERRLRVLHGLVAEDFKAGPAAEWMLATERRAKITDLLGVAPEAEQVIEARRRKSRGPSVRGLILALAACVVLAFISISLIGGVGQSAKSAGMKEKSMLVRYSMAERDAVAPSDDFGAVAKRDRGAPLKKPDSSYAHLEANSPFASKPPPAMRATQVASDTAILDGVDRSNPGAGGGGPSGAVLAESSARPVSGAADDAQALATNERPSAAKAKESSSRVFLGGGAVGGAESPAGGDPPEIATRDLSEFIPPVEGVTIPGIPAATGEKGRDIITAGNRSGDEAITRNNIDAILNNPDRVAGAPQEGEGIAALTGTFSDEAIAQVEKKMAERAKPAPPASSMTKVGAGALGIDAIPAAPARPAEVEGKDKGSKAWTGSFSNGAVATDEKAMEELAGANGRAGAVESEFRTRNAVGWLVAGEANEAGLGGDGGMPQEPQAGIYFNRNGTSESRFKSSLRLGTEVESGRGDATNFGDLGEMGRLAGEAKPQQDLDYYDAPIQSETAAESQKARSRGITEMDARDVTIEALTLSKNLETDPEPTGDEVRAQLLEEVERAWNLSVPMDGKAVVADPAAPAEPLRTSQPLTAEHAKMVDEVRRKLYIAEGNRELGKYDESQKTYEEVLRIDPYNKAARRGMEKVAAAKADYYRAAYDQTRAKLSLEEDEAPETPAALEQKKQAALDLMSEVVSAAEPFSTFSLHVSDASFKLAQAAMERGEVPAAEGIRPEEFYNAFDYGDPAPASGEPVVCVTEQSAHPAFAQRNLLRIGVRTGSQGRGASTPLNLTLLLDHSGSMEREDRNAGLAMAVRQLSGLLKEGDTITVAGFSRQPRLLADRLPGARAEELNELIARTPSEGGTNLEEGLKLGEELAKRQFNPAAQNRVVLFTDGAANLGDARPEALQTRIEALRQQGIAFDAAGFGADGLNDKLLERLTRNGNGRYYIVDGPEDADAGFAKQLAGAFRPAAENVKVQVRFNPARVAKYKLIGFEEHRLKKEDFRNDAVDAAEMAAEEAGNALYQIETLPQGEGEVGEVSVRFRDVASGQMVERTWTIPYDAQAPAFDRATPSIQLAGLAAFAAEKLRAAPMADAVDFQQLGQVYAGVRARYPNSQPVADLGSMIGRMK